MHCHRLEGHRNGVVVAALASALLWNLAESSVFDTPIEEIQSEDVVEYGQEVSAATAGMGIGLSVVIGFITFITMLGMCCRCKRIHRADLAIAEAEGNNDGKGLDDMYEIEDYEDDISKHRKILWVFSLMIFLGYLFCAGYAYNGARTANSAFDDIFDGTDELLTEVQNALCAENGVAECSPGSVGDFMLNIAGAVVDELESIVDFIYSLSAVVAPLFWVASNLTTAGTVINGTEVAVVNINTSIPSVNLILEGDGYVADFLGGEGLPTLDGSIASDIAEGRTALQGARQLTEDSTVEVLDQMTGENATITRVRYQLDDIQGNEVGSDQDLRNITLSTVYDVLEPMRELTEDLYSFQNNKLVDVREFIEKYLDLSVQAVAGLIFLPGVIMLLTALCSGLFQSSKPLYLNMAFVFSTQFLFCLVAGVFLVIAKINGDVCDHHLDLIEANIGERFNTTIQGTLIVVDFEKAHLLMTCDGEIGDIPTETNNIVDILEAEQAFNISKQLREASSLITDNSELLTSPKSTIKSAQEELSPLNDFVDLEVGADVNVTESAAEIDDFLEEIPPSPFEWDNRAHQDSLDDFYLKNVSDFSWNNESTGDVTYRYRLELVNALIKEMMPNIIGGTGFENIYDLYNFTLARNLTRSTVCATTSNFYPRTANPRRSNLLNIVIYTYDNHWDDLCGNVTLYANLTERVEELVEKNDETRLDLEEVRHNMGNIEGNLSAIGTYQTQMGLLRNDMNGSLRHLASTLDILVVDLNQLARDFLDLNEVVMAASNYTMCGYIGTFYQRVYLDAMCTDLQGNVEAVAVPALIVVILMFISFCVQGIYGPSMRKRPRGSAELEAGRTHFNAGADENNLPTPHSPTPLVGNSGF